jgi:hypothetical protein
MNVTVGLLGLNECGEQDAICPLFGLEHGFPAQFVFADGDVLTRAYERQLQQFGLVRDALEPGGFGQFHELETGGLKDFAFSVEHSVPPEAVGEAFEFTGSDGALSEVDHVDFDAAFFEEPFGGSSF